MTITGLLGRYAFPGNGSDLPILVLGGGWASPEVSDVELLQIANAYDVCVLSLYMRVKQNLRDASGREIYDIYDGINYLRAKYPSILSQTKAGMWGMSGSGGNALAAACKFPDFWTMIIAAFGMSDYGRDGTYGWYQQNASYQAQIAASVGDTPANVPDNYYARDATAAIQNFTGGDLRLYHDDQDTTVDVSHTNRITAAMDAAGLTNYTATITTTTDPVRITHGIAFNGTPGLAIQSDCVDDFLAADPWTIPTSGTLTVIGYIVTKRFTIWLNSGLDAAATVVYDTAAGTYTVTPLTSNAVVAVSITQGALTASGNTNGETTFTVA